MKKNYYVPKKPVKLVYCIELDTTYKNTCEAQRETGVDCSSIRKACLGIRHSAGKHPDTGEKLHWKYVECKVLKEEEEDVN